MDKETAIERLKEFLESQELPTIYTIVRHVSPSGMQRSIQVLVAHNGEIVDISYWVAKAGILPYYRDKHGLKVHGVGMDMGFHTVYNISHALYGEGNRILHRWL